MSNESQSAQWSQSEVGSPVRAYSYVREPAAVPLLSTTQQSTSCTNHHTESQPLETDFPATDTLQKPLETEFGSQCSVTSSNQASISPSSVVVSCKISYDMTPYSSTLSALHPICRICQSPSEKNNVLITPCRCDGTLKHVHGTCLRVSNDCLHCR